MLAILQKQLWTLPGYRDGGGGFIGDVFDSVGSAVSDVASGIGDAVSSIGDALPAVSTVASFIPGPWQPFAIATNMANAAAHNNPLGVAMGAMGLSNVTGGFSGVDGLGSADASSWSNLGSDVVGSDAYTGWEGGFGTDTSGFSGLDLSGTSGSLASLYDPSLTYTGSLQNIVDNVTAGSSGLGNVPSSLTDFGGATSLANNTTGSLGNVFQNNIGVPQDIQNLSGSLTSTGMGDIGATGYKDPNIVSDVLDTGSTQVTNTTPTKVLPEILDKGSTQVTGKDWSLNNMFSDAKNTFMKNPITNSLKLAGGIMNAVNSQSNAKQLQNLYNTANQRDQFYNNQLQNTYTNPASYLSSPEYQAASNMYNQQIARQDAAAGRRSQYGARANQMQQYALANLQNYRNNLSIMARNQTTQGLGNALANTQAMRNNSLLGLGGSLGSIFGV